MINQKGQSLIEALIALGAAAFIVSAVAMAVITAVNNSDFSKNQNLATQYAQQGMDILRHKSESDWQSFSAYGGNYCLSQDSTALTPQSVECPKNISNFFVRQITISQNSSGCSGNARVSVSVAWTDGKCTSSANVYCHAAVLDSCLANITQTQLP